MSIFSKPLAELNANDLAELIEGQLTEDENLEFKQTLPTKNGEPDRWLKDQKEIGERARNEILEEVVAFANSHSGTVIIGIEETDDKPPRANKILPLPKCHELASRLALQARDCIEPRLASLEVVGIPTAADGSGVVVIRVPRSRKAPHRLKPTMECYFRRADRSEKMTMTEIQDLTLNLSRGDEVLKEELAQRSQDFQQEAGSFGTGTANRALGLRVTLSPTAPIRIHNIFNKANEVTHVAPPLISSDGKQWTQAAAPGYAPPFRPILRGAEARTSSRDYSQQFRLFQDGGVEYLIICSVEPNKRDDQLPITWIVAQTFNGLLTADKVRALAEAPGLEYALDIEVAGSGADLPLGGWESNYASRIIGTLPSVRLRLPLFSVGPRSDFEELINQVCDDFYHAAGQEKKWRVQIREPV